MTNIIDMARKHLYRKNIDADATDVKTGEKTTVEEPPEALDKTFDESSTDPKDKIKETEDEPKKRRKKTKNCPLARFVDNHPHITAGIITSAMAFIIVCTVTSVAYATQIADDKLTDAINQYQTAQQALDTQQSELQTALDTADSTLASVTDEQVFDPSTLDNLKTTADAARPLLTDPGSEPNSDEFIFQRIYDYMQLTQACDTQKNEIAESTASVNAGVTAVNDSVAAKQRDDAMKATASKITDAKSILGKSKDAVLDDANRNALSGLIDEANALVNNADATKEQFDDMTNRLQSGMDNVNADMQKKIEHDEAIRKAEEKKKARGSASAGSSAFDTWTPSYYNAYGTAEADANGALTQWADNYFIAHDWSANGKRIASRPAHVVINGTTYHYVSEKVVSRDTYFDDTIKAFCYANNGIAFQTCYGANYLITHYEPGY